MAGLTVLFYMDESGHILDNEQHPVTGPYLVKPVIPKVRLLGSDEETFEYRVEIYRAHRMKQP